MDLTHSQQFAQFTDDLTLNDVPPDVVESVKRLILDAVGLCYAAADMDYSKKALEAFREFDSVRESTVIGQSCKMSAVWAALVNGIQIHGHDYDDTHAGSVAHTASVIVPIVLALAERNRLKGIQILESAIAGFETSCRVGLASRGGFHKRGFHTTSLAGAMGGVIAASKSLGLNPHQIWNAQGIAGSTAAGLREAYLSGGSWTKMFHPGWAAHGAITAALLARQGFTGTPTVYEGRFGLFKSHLHPEDADYAALTDDMGSRWEIRNINFKPYPCGVVCHAFIESALNLLKNNALVTNDIKQITCYIHPDAAQTVCEPVPTKRRPESGYHAKFSLQFAVAAALVDGDVTIGTFTDEKAKDPAILSVVDRVEYQFDRESSYPETFPSWLEIKLHDERVLVDRQPHNKGSLNHPMKENEIKMKFFNNASLKIGESQIKDIYECIMNLEDLKDIILLGSYLNN